MAHDQYHFLLHPDVPYRGYTQSIYCPIADQVQYTQNHRSEGGGNLTLEEYIAHTGVQWRVTSPDELDVVDNAFHEEMVSDPEPITCDDYNEMLRILPPCKYGTWAGVELFHMSERLSGTIVSWYASIGKKYYSCLDHAYRSPSDMADKFGKAHQRSR